MATSTVCKELGMNMTPTFTVYAGRLG